MEESEKKKGRLGLLMLIAAAVMLVVVSACQVKGVINMAEGYRELMDCSLDEDTVGTIYFDDGIYSSIGFGIEILAEETGKQERRAEFVRSSLEGVYRNICAVDVMYAMIAVTLAALFIYEHAGKTGAGHCAAVAAAALSAYALLVLAAAAASKALGLPLYAPSGASLTTLAVSLLSMIGGCCAEGLLLRKLQKRDIAAVMAVPLAFMLFIFSASYEGQLYQPAEIESFDYVWEIEGIENAEDFRYDEEKGVMTGRGKEYPPEMVPNPEKLTGAAAAAAAVFETADPWSGTGLEMVRSFTESPIPLIVCLLYAVKAMIWAVLLFRTRAGKKTEAEE